MLAQFLEDMENSDRNRTIGSDRYIQGDGAAFSVNEVDPILQRIKVKPGFLTGSPSLADRQQQMPDNPLRGRKILWRKGLPLSFFRFLIKIMVFTGSESLMGT